MGSNYKEIINEYYHQIMDLLSWISSHTKSAEEFREILTAMDSMTKEDISFYVDTFKHQDLDDMFKHEKSNERSREVFKAYMKQMGVEVNFINDGGLQHE